MTLVLGTAEKTQRIGAAEKTRRIPIEAAILLLLLLRLGNTNRAHQRCLYLAGAGDLLHCMQLQSALWI